MAKWELAIAVRDEADLSSGHKRKKSGDIIAYKPYPWTWGSKETTGHLMVIVDNLTEEEVQELCQPLYEDDKKPDILLNEKKTHINKRKYSINIDNLKTNVLTDLDMDKVKDVNLHYQPFKDADIVIDADEESIDFDFIKNKYNNEYKKGKKK